jgi:hypothetical protein
VERALAAVRGHLGMEVAYLSEFVDGRSVFRAVDAPGFEETAYVGASMSLEDVYCQHILEGRLPELIPDTAAEPLAAALPITQALPIGSHVSIPIRRADGSPYGMFCCLSRTPNHSLNGRDLEIMRVFANLAGGEIQGALAARATRETAEARVAQALAGGGLAMAFQPIFDLGAARPSGFEALCRFALEPRRGPRRLVRRSRVGGAGGRAGARGDPRGAGRARGAAGGGLRVRERGARDGARPRALRPASRARPGADRAGADGARRGRLLRRAGAGAGAGALSGRQARHRRRGARATPGSSTSCGCGRTS